MQKLILYLLFSYLVVYPCQNNQFISESSDHENLRIQSNQPMKYDYGIYPPFIAMESESMRINLMTSSISNNNTTTTNRIFSHSRRLDNSNSNSITNNNQYGQSVSRRPIVRMLVYDKVNGYLNWVLDWFKQGALKRCPTKCHLMTDINEQGIADVVIFHAPTHTKIPPRAPQNSLYVLLSLEQPQYARILNNKQYLESNFDLLTTYSMASRFPGTTVPNMPVTYFPLNIVSMKSILSRPRPFKEKTGYNTGVSVAVFTSNCKAAGAHNRLAYLQELMKYIKIHSYGGCLNNRQEPSLPEDRRWPPLAQRRARKVKVLSNYKFYLAFENLALDDYVSEKIFEGLFAGTVPIYRGASTISRFMPSNDSFINANTIHPQELANIINKLAGDEKEYNKFFQFKSRPISPEFEDIALKSYIHPNVLCRLCSYGLQARTHILAFQNSSLTSLQ